MTVDALLAIAQISEDLHLEILETSDPTGGLFSRPVGLFTSLIYSSVKLGIYGVGTGLSLAFNAPSPPSPSFPTSSAHTSLVAVLNGVCGDHLARRANPLAMQMSLRSRSGLPLPLSSSEDLDTALGTDLSSRRKIVLFVHGLCADDSW